MEGHTRKFRSAGAVFIICLLAFSLILAMDSFLPEETVEEADAIRSVGSYITLNQNQTRSNQKGNVVELYTGPGETRYSDQIYGNVVVWRTSKVLRDRIMVNLYFESEDPSLVIGSVNPMVYDIQPGIKQSTKGIAITLSLASPMLQYSTGIDPWVRVKVYGTWMAQWNLGLNGTWESGVIQPIYIYVHVVPYHYLQMSFDPAMVQLGPGGTGEIDVIVLNSGNGNERVELYIPNENTYAKEGWIFEFNRTTLDIGPRSEARARIKVTAPRSTVRWHMETKDFSVVATSYYDKYQANEEDREPHTYEMSFMAYIFGLDFTYIPWAWAALFYVIFFIILFNLGINPTTLRKRKLGKGQEPGFIKLYHITRDPKKRAEHRRRREEIRRIKAEEKDRKKKERDLQKQRQSLEKEKPREASPPKPRAKVLDLKKVDDDFDLVMLDDRPKSEKKSKFTASPGKKGSDDFDIMLDLPKKNEKPRARPLFGKSRTPAGRSETDFKDALDDL